MSEEKKPKFNEHDLGANLFVNEKFKVVIVESVMPKKLPNGDMHDFPMEYERQVYTKLFQSPDNRKEIASLPAPAKELLLWILLELKPGKDYIWLNRGRYMKENNILSRTTVTKAIEKLNNKFIHISNVRGVYFINPKYVFNGNRVKKYKDHVAAYRPKKNVSVDEGYYSDFDL